MTTAPHGRGRLIAAAVAGAILALSPAAEAADGDVLRVGAVSLRPFGKANISVAFLERMRELGYQQDRNFRFEFIQVPDRGDYHRAYRELVGRKVDILVAGGPEIALKAAVAASDKLPIVMVASDYDPLARGYVQRLSRPGGNVTGVFFQQIALTKKRLQILKEALPGVGAITVFWDRNSADQWKGVKAAARALGYAVHGVEFSERPYEYDRAFARVPAASRGALMILASPVFSLPVRERLPEFALAHKIPTMFHVSFYPRAGGLMSYGVSFTNLFKRAADYVDKIARGARPGDMPVEQPTTFELVVNLKTAERLGVSLPQSILLRADEVIE
jgi:putative ABC transport system substrate-binding protein